MTKVHYIRLCEPTSASFSLSLRALLPTLREAALLATPRVVLLLLSLHWHRVSSTAYSFSAPLSTRPPFHRHRCSPRPPSLPFSPVFHYHYYHHHLSLSLSFPESYHSPAHRPSPLRRPLKNTTTFFASKVPTGSLAKEAKKIFMPPS
ncbi:hypothetical protein E2C01_042369 [Portunus trituberculatus]|uniref:Uncharacterized protein n=1 Tax=Portunus trituberculatus TaxID=210409 RepID=A0A5B7FQ18_PORTR|nr:hypothetical protein [Portunus trituberculatus]